MFKKIISCLMASAIIVCSGILSVSAEDNAKSDNEETTIIYHGIVDESTQYENNLKNKALNKVTTKSNSKKYELTTNSVDEAYRRVEIEENYIVNLINNMNSDIKTNKSNWEYNLKWLKDNYEAIKTKSKKNYQDQFINLKYVDSYIEAYEFVLLDKNLPKEKQTTLRTKSSYSRTDVVDYANTYYSDYNSDYPDWTSYGGDCANFVSQCLYAGGKEMEGTPGTSSSAQDFSNWFSTGSSLDVDNVSSTWRGADAFKHYWKSNAPKYKTFTSFDGAYAYGYRGDAVTLLNSNGRGFHTLVIVDYENSDLVYAAHTNNTNTGLLSNINYDFIIYGMYE